MSETNLHRVDMKPVSDKCVAEKKAIVDTQKDHNKDPNS